VCVVPIEPRLPVAVRHLSPTQALQRWPVLPRFLALDRQLVVERLVCIAPASLPVTHTQRDTHTHTDTRKDTRRHTEIRKDTRRHTDTQTFTLTHFACLCVHTDTHTHVRTQTPTQIDRQTHTHTHTCPHLSWHAASSESSSFGI
jgi:hypothetical protein